MSRSRPLYVAIVSLGCPKALVDSEKMLASLAEDGCIVGAPPQEADVVLINTCAFIAPAREESMEAIRQAVSLKRGGRVRRVVVAGCLPQREGAELLAAEPGIDAIVGVFQRDRIVEAVTGRQRGFHCLEGRGGPCLDDLGRFRLTPRHTAYLRLAEGCSQGCSYCTIPAIRGPLRSKPMDLIVREADELAADGAVELNLIAQDTTAYGRDLGDGTDLAALLRRLDAVAGVRWVRLMYAHPASLSEAAIEAMAACPRVVRYLDMPLQHVSDDILRRMGRGYGRGRIEGLLGALRARMPGIALRTTFIVGFPGEGEREFEELMEFVGAQRLDAVGVFPYYPEAGTAAARLPGQVPDEIKDERLQRLMLAQQAIAFAANEARIGAGLEVLVDGADGEGRCFGRHAGQAPEVDGICRLTRPQPAGRIVRAKVVAGDDYDLVVEAAAGLRPRGMRNGRGEAARNDK